MRMASSGDRAASRDPKAHNRDHNITPVGISKAVRDLTERVRKVAERESYQAGKAATR